ncbi:hypothetical protein IMSAG025_01730 [Muribaculaceae bacterium]|nr:hypothetical protein IMSAG025_01730 [Muribaculaceae bacterium]
MLFIKTAQVIRKNARIHFAAKAPVIFIFMARFQRTCDQVLHPIADKNIEPVYKRKRSQGFHSPLSVILGRYRNDFRFFGIVRGIKFMRCQKLPVRAGNLNHCHDSARFFPNHILLIPLFIKKQTLICFFGCYQEVLFPFIF